jgi:hypothetical protein
VVHKKEKNKVGVLRDLYILKKEERDLQPMHQQAHNSLFEHFKLIVYNSWIAKGGHKRSATER